jgi:hypothetical protein
VSTIWLVLGAAAIGLLLSLVGMPDLPLPDFNLPNF